MQDPQKLQEENERLKTELKEYKEIKNSLGFWGKLFLNITAPSILKGFGFALICFVIIYYSVTLDSLIPIIIGGLILLLSLFIGAWYAEVRFQKKLAEIQEKTKDTLNNSKEIIPELIENYLITRFSSDSKKEINLAALKKTVDRLIDEYTPLLETGFHLIKSFIFRFWAFGTLMAILLAVIGFGTFMATYLQVERLDVQNDLIKAQNKRLVQQTYLQEAERRSSLIFLLSNIMDEVAYELRESKSSTRILTPNLTGQIIALSARLKPYRYLDGDSLIKKPLSPERGQLLISLSNSDLNDSTTFTIYKKGTFGYAELKDAYFIHPKWNGIFLRKADLSGAYFPKAELVNSNLRHANLSYADLNGANLSSADLGHANLKHTDLKDAVLFETNLSNADLRGANFTDVSLWQTNLYDAKTNSRTFFTGKEEDIDFYVDTIPRFDSLDIEKKVPYYLIKKK